MGPALSTAAVLVQVQARQQAVYLAQRSIAQAPHEVGASARAMVAFHEAGEAMLTRRCGELLRDLPAANEPAAIAEPA